MIECIDTRFFKLRRNTIPYIEEQQAYGNLCQVVKARYGFIVNVYMEVE